MAGKSLLLQLTGEMPLFKIMDFFVDNKGLDFTKEQIADGAGLSRASVFNYWDELEGRAIVKITRKEGKTTYYALNAANPITKRILELEATLIRQAMEKAVQRKDVEAESCIV
ncbi:hypothetical protein HYS47_01015 [Candidatus Woesearchaeota archaeon]|nr:hypothetical protein [Candidatus Woesearchaeota archaeon]